MTLYAHTYTIAHSCVGGGRCAPTADLRTGFGRDVDARVSGFVTSFILSANGRSRCLSYASTYISRANGSAVIKRPIPGEPTRNVSTAFSTRNSAIRQNNDIRFCIILNI